MVILVRRGACLLVPAPGWGTTVTAQPSPERWAAGWRVSSARQVELVGGGGTDMGAGIAAADALRPRPAITVALTDGYTPWPDRAPKGMRVVLVLLGDA